SEPAVELSFRGIDGQAVLAALTGDGIEQRALLRRFVEYLAGCRSLEEVVVRSRQLGGRREPTRRWRPRRSLDATLPVSQVEGLARMRMPPVGSAVSVESQAGP